MYYFHVIIKQKVSNSLECIFKDISEEELNKKFVNPYKLCKDLYYEGRILPIREISNITIIKTTETAESMEHMNLKEIEKDDLEFIVRRIGICATITHYGEKVTNNYLSTAPCQGTLVSDFLDKIKHPVLVRIISLIF